MDLFDSIEAKAKNLADAARKIILAELESKKLGIPGKAIWNGYGTNGQATVIKNNKIINVKTTSTIVLPLGTEVYVDETFTVEYKTKDVKKEDQPKTPKEPKIVKRVKKNRRPSLPGPEVVEDVRGATWLVYHEYLKELNWTTEAETGTNPYFEGWSLFLTLLPLAFLGGGVLLGVIYWTLFEFKIETVPSITISDLPTPETHPDVEANPDLNGEDYNYFLILQGVVDQLFTSSGILAFPPNISDGFWLGKNQAISNNLFFIGQDNQASVESSLSGGLTFSDKIFIRPWQYGPDDRLAGLLTHFGPGKVQAALYRVVGVFPSKKFIVNVHSWPTPDFDITPYNDEWSDEQKTAWRDNLPEMRHKQFVIPDDIAEWDKILGDGLVDQDNEKADIVPYEIVPLHDWKTYEGENEPYDLTKFASYSENNLFLNYMVKCYAPWTNLGDTFRINYFLLTVRFTNSTEDNTISTSYKFTPSTFDLPQEFKVFGDIVLEDPNFPLQAGERNIAERQITFTIQGTNDDPSQPEAVIINAVRGDQEKTGFLPGSDPDGQGAYSEDENGNPVYIIGENLYFQIDGEEPPGFLYNNYTGQYVFNQNNEAYVTLKRGQSVTFEIDYTVVDPEGSIIVNQVIIEVQGSDSTFTAPDPSPPIANGVERFDQLEDNPAPVNDWDPEPFVESLELGETQVFEKVEVTIPLPERDSDNNILGWQGRVSRVELKDVQPPVIRKKYRNGKTIILGSADEADAQVGVDDFIFSVVTDGKENGSGAQNYLVDFTPKPKNYDFLAQGEEIKITYTIQGLVNNAPFVGNFENVSEFQQRKILSDAIAFAYPDDWRSKIWNPREAPTFNNIFVQPTGDSITRDSNIPVINIDQVTRAVSTNFIAEFNMVDPGSTSPFGAASITNEDEVFLTRGLVYEFDEASEELLFYASDDLQRQSPLDWESVISILETSGQQVKKTDYFVDAMLPQGLDRLDETGKKWRYNYQYSVPSKGYMIYGYIPR